MRRGFTLIELLTVMAITGVLVVAILGTVRDARTEVAHADRRQAWSGGAATALAVIGRDARAATTVQVGVELVLVGPRGEVRWRRAEVDGRSVLQRVEGAQATVMAADVSGFEVSRRERRLDVALEFAGADGRFGTRHRHAAVVALFEGQ